MERNTASQITLELTPQLITASDIEEVSKIFCNAVLQLIDLDYCAFLMHDEDTGVFVRKNYYAKPGNPADTLPVYVRFTEGILSNGNGPYFLNSERPSPFFYNDPFSEGTEIIIPLKVNNKINGVIIGNKKGDIATPADFNDAADMVSQLFALYRKSDAEKQTSPSAMKDKMRKLQQQNERLKKSNEELQQFAYIASHDLQEPLRVISNYIHLFLRNYGTTLDDDGKEFLAYAQEGAQRMHRLVKDLLAFSRIEYSNDPKTHFNGTKMLEEALGNLQVAIEESDALILYQDMPELYGNENQIKSLFQNLVDNAVKFKGSNDPLIFIDSVTKKDKWKFSIRDNGIGIEQQFHERIFGFFNRLHPNDKYKGSGLGLSICRKIIEKHNGDIYVESIPGHGTTFHFTIGRG